jgi:hypothetical protein
MAIVLVNEGRLRPRPRGWETYRIGRGRGNVLTPHTHILKGTWRNLDMMTWQYEKYRLITGS